MFSFSFNFIIGYFYRVKTEKYKTLNNCKCPCFVEVGFKIIVGINDNGSNLLMLYRDQTIIDSEEKHGDFQTCIL